MAATAATADNSAIILGQGAYPVQLIPQLLYLKHGIAAMVALLLAVVRVLLGC